jgi:hypothetical protein
MSHVKHCFLVAALLLGAPACMDAPGAQEQSSSDAVEPAPSWNVAKNLQLDVQADDITPRADCAFIEWCNRPASISPDIGTVCRVRTGCAFPPSQATVNECTSEALSVCGAITQPAFICRQGGSCP